MRDRPTLPWRVAVALLASLGALPLRAADEQPRTFTVDQLRQDFALLRDALDELHPSLHWYTPALELELAFDQVAGKIDHPMTEREFHNLVQPVLALVRCGHTYLQTSSAYDDWVDRQPTAYLPMGLWAEGDKLHVLWNGSNDPSIQPGDEIAEVNGVAASRIIARAKELLSADGYNETWKYALINAFEGSHLKRFLFHTLDLREPYALAVVRPDGQRFTRTVARKPRPDGGVSGGGRPKEPPLRDFQLLSGGVGMLTIRSFNYEDAETFHREIFKQVAEKNIQHLIIDVRENTGGNGDYANDLMKYLMSRPFRTELDQWAKVRHPERPTFARHLDARSKKLLVDNNKYLRTAGDRHYFDNPGIGLRQPSDRYRYAGTVYLLTSGRTFSSAALFASNLKAQREVTVIGEETGGGQAGCTAGINHKLTLPHTRMRLALPVFRIRTANPAPNRGRGLMPDHPIRYTWRDRVAGTDLELRKAQELITRAGAGSSR